MKIRVTSGTGLSARTRRLMLASGMTVQVLLLVFLTIATLKELRIAWWVWGMPVWGIAFATAGWAGVFHSRSRAASTMQVLLVAAVLAIFAGQAASILIPALR